MNTKATTPRAYPLKHNAKRAALKAAEAAGGTYTLREVKGGWTFDIKVIEVDQRSLAEQQANATQRDEDMGIHCIAEWREPTEAEQAAAEANADEMADYRAAMAAGDAEMDASAVADSLPAQEDLPPGLTADEQAEWIATRRPEVPASPTAEQQAWDAAAAEAEKQILADQAAREAAIRSLRLQPAYRDAAQEAAATIARFTLGIETLATRGSDSLDFHDLAVWTLEKALMDAYAAGALAATQQAQEKATAAKPATKPATERAPRPAKTSRNPLEMPVITSPTNQATARLCERIRDARGDLAKLQAFTFKPSNNYYRQAYEYLQALKAEAQQQQAA